MAQFDLKKFLVENKLTANSRSVNEALNKSLQDFGPDLQKRLQALGFETKLFTGTESVPFDAVDKIIANPKLAGIAYKKYENQGNVYEYIKVIVHKDRAKDLEKVKKYFQTPDGEYGPDKDMSWVIKNVRNVNPGDIISSEIRITNTDAELSYYRNTTPSTGPAAAIRDKY